MPPTTTSDDSEKHAGGFSLKDRRFKLSRACDRCRRRRIRCDEGHPCQACQSSTSECTFEETGKRSHPHKSKKTKTLEDRMRQLETLIQAIPPSVFAAVSNGTPLPAGWSDSAESGSPQQQRQQPQQPPISLQSLSLPLPTGVPPPVLNTFPLTNPSSRFGPNRGSGSDQSHSSSSSSAIDQLVEDSARLSIAPSYLYFDDKGFTRWQGETSGLPLLDLLVLTRSAPQEDGQLSADSSWFPERSPQRLDVDPETMWKTVTSVIEPSLMDALVTCFMSTSYYLMPFLHLPTFLQDYGTPEMWKEPGFVSFIVAICCLSSRHIDDPRVRTDPKDGISAGAQWFELFQRLRGLPAADRPTLYTIQAVFVAGVYAIGHGKLSKALALLSEAVTLGIDAGLHRSVDEYDYFDQVEDENRKRTFWCIYIWDKQASAHFGRPPMIRLRDCDVEEPSVVDDEYISRERIGTQPEGTESRMSAFICMIRLAVVLELVLDTPPSRPHLDSSKSFLNKATTLFSGFKHNQELRDEEALLDEVTRSIPAHWACTPETMGSEDVVRVTQAERLLCFEQYVRMLIHRHRFSALVAQRTIEGSTDQTPAEKEALKAAHGCALQIVGAHLNVATRGLMTYYGVHVIHQLTQAGRSLVAIFLNTQAEDLHPLQQSAMEALRSCVGLLRRFSGRYVCGMRSTDMMEEFCRLTQIPLDTSTKLQDTNHSRPPWVRPVRKKASSNVRSPSIGVSLSGHASSPNDDAVSNPTASPVSPTTSTFVSYHDTMMYGDTFMDVNGIGTSAALTSFSTPVPFSSSSSGNLSPSVSRNSFSQMNVSSSFASGNSFTSPFPATNGMANGIGNGMTNGMGTTYQAPNGVHDPFSLANMSMAHSTSSLGSALPPLDEKDVAEFMALLNSPSSPVCLLDGVVSNENQASYDPQRSSLFSIN